MKKILTLVLALILMLAMVSFSACTNPSDNDSAITVTDQIGRTVTIDAPAERIVSGYYISSSACIALGLKSKLVATEERISTRPIYQLAAPELIDNVANVGSAKAFQLEVAIESNPDLVILPNAARDYADTFAELGIPAIVVNPENHEALITMIEIISKMTGSEQKANQLIKYYNDTIAEIEDLTKDVTAANKQKVYIASPSSYLKTAPKDMYQASLITTAGGINAGNGLSGDAWTDVSYEQILEINPDIIVIPTNNFANGQPDYTKADIMADEVLADITAVKNGTIYNMPAGLEAWDSPVPSGVLGMLWMLNLLHPDLYTLDEFTTDATNFYKTFYGFDMDTKIITG